MGRDIPLERPLIIGILNFTPDSFYDGGRFNGDLGKAADFALAMMESGADIIDIGGESSRPGSSRVRADEETARVLPLIKSILRQRPAALLSIDTWKAEVARAALDMGACIVNDIAAFRMDEAMLPLLAESECGYVLMHMQGTPETMQQCPQYNDIAAELKSFFQERLALLESAGVAMKRVALDPGIGFGKTFQDNLKLIASPALLRAHNRPLLYGISRKSFIGAMLDRPPEARLSGTTAIHMILLAQGVDLLRVHDVPDAVDAVNSYLALKEFIDES